VLAEPILAGLNPQQREAVQATEGPLLVLAGAGSGKTRVLTHRIAYLIGACGIPPEGLLAVTFTNKAAEEMRERVRKLLGPETESPWVCTFHSACVRILRREAGHLGLSRGFGIYDESDSLAVVKEALRRLGLDPKVEEPRRLRWRIDQWKNEGLLPARAAERAADLDAEHAVEVYATYQRLLAEAQALDFGDLLLRTVELFERFPAVLEHYRARWQYVLVDEYQDTNRVQYRLVNQLAGGHRNLCVVGDPDQCLPPSAEIMTPRGPRAIRELRAGDVVIAGSGWGKTHPGVVEKVSTRRYRGRLLRIHLRSGRTLEATPNHICFARLDPVRGMHYVYLMWRRGKGYRIGTTSGVRSSKDGAILNGLLVWTNAEVADAVWILHSTPDLGEAHYHEQLYAARYGIPTLVFHVRGRRMAMDQGWVDRLFEELDTEAAAARLMRDLDLDPRFPHHRPYAVVRSGFERRYVWFTMFGDPRPHVLRPWHEHRVQLVTSGEELRRNAANRFSVRPGRKGTWRIETSRKHYAEGHELALAICSLGDLELVSRAQLTPGKPFHFMPASHLQRGMAVPVLEGDGVREDVIERIESGGYEGEVCDLSVPELRNFAAEGILVHNSIYAWRGASLRNILDFEHDFPDARVVRLERNYRSTRPILDGASGVIAHNLARKEKRLLTEREGGDPIRVLQLDDERDEARLVLRTIQSLVRAEGRGFGQFAVFYRTNAQSRPFEEELQAARVPYLVVGGLRFYERAEVKDVLAWLRLAVNPADDLALRRIVNVPPRGIGRATLERAADLAARDGIPLLEGLARAEAAGLLGRATARVREFRKLAAGLLPELAGAPPARAIARVLEGTGYLAHLEREGTPESEARLENLRELLSGAEDFEARPEEAADGGTPLERYLDRIALVSDADQVELGSQRVSLITVHTAKGLEFPVVFLVGMEEGIFPHASSLTDPADLEEERRLCYVGMTRAMERLVLTCARSRRRFGTRSTPVPSRFLAEIPHGVVEGVRGARAGPAAAGERELDYSLAQAEAAEGVAAPGLRVRHPVFGSGTILAVSGRGPGQKLRIRFDRAGTKTLVLRYAQLEIG
jgi:DNA helicase-2/ATP-dependent DNA helicase PcrA